MYSFESTGFGNTRRTTFENQSISGIKDSLVVVHKQRNSVTNDFQHTNPPFPCQACFFYCFPNNFRIRTDICLGNELPPLFLGEHGCDCFPLRQKFVPKDQQIYHANSQKRKPGFAEFEHRKGILPKIDDNPTRKDVGARSE